MTNDLREATYRGFLINSPTRLTNSKRNTLLRSTQILHHGAPNPDFPYRPSHETTCSPRGTMLWTASILKIIPTATLSMTKHYPLLILLSTTIPNPTSPKSSKKSVSQNLQDQIHNAVILYSSSFSLPSLPFLFELVQHFDALAGC